MEAGHWPRPHYCGSLLEKKVRPLQLYEPFPDFLVPGTIMEAPPRENEIKICIGLSMQHS